MIDIGPGVPADVEAGIIAQIPAGYTVRYQPAKRTPGGQERWVISYEQGGRVWSERTPVLAGIVPAVERHLAAGQPMHRTNQAVRAERDQQIRDAARAGMSVVDIAHAHRLAPIDVRQILEATPLERTGRRVVFREATPVESVRRMPGIVRRALPWRATTVRFMEDES